MNMAIELVWVKRRIQIFSDGELWRDLASSSFKSLVKELRGSKSLEEVVALFQEGEPRLCLRLAVQLLAKEAMPSAKLKKRLQRRGFLDSVIEGVIERCQDEGWLSDGEWIESYIRVRLAKGYGKRRIIAELKHKGIAPPPGLQIDDTSALKDVVAKRYSGIQDRKEQKRAITSLCRRGFDLERVLTYFS